MLSGRRHPHRHKSSEECEALLHDQVHTLERTLLATQKSGDLPEESRICNNIAKKLEQLGEWKRALEFHHYDRQICHTLDDVDGELMALSNMIAIFTE